MFHIRVIRCTNMCMRRARTSMNRFSHSPLMRSATLVKPSLQQFSSKATQPPPPSSPSSKNTDTSANAQRFQFSPKGVDPLRKKKDPTILRRILALLLAGGITYTAFTVLILPAWECYSNGRASSQWKSVEARLVGDDSPFGVARPPSSNELSDAHLGLADTYRLEYEYTVDGRVYRAQRYSFRYDERVVDVRGAVAKRVRQRGDDGALVLDVYVDPAHPEHACVEPQAPRDVWYPLALGGLFQVGALHYLRYALRFARK